jgi:hypothetical protein
LDKTWLGKQLENTSRVGIWNKYNSICIYNLTLFETLVCGSNSSWTKTLVWPTRSATLDLQMACSKKIQTRSIHDSYMEKGNSDSINQNLDPNKSTRRATKLTNSIISICNTLFYVFIFSLCVWTKSLYSLRSKKKVSKVKTKFECLYTPYLVYRYMQI